MWVRAQRRAGTGLHPCRSAPHAGSRHESTARDAQTPAHDWIDTDTTWLRRDGASVCARAIVLPGGRWLTPRGIPVTGWQRERRVVGEMRLHHLFFLYDPPPEHQEIEGQ